MMKKVTTALLLAGLTLVAFLPCVCAAPDDSASVWNIPFIGGMKVPAGFSAVEVKDFRAFVDQEKQAAPDPKKSSSAKDNKAAPTAVPEGTPTLLKDNFPSDKDAALVRLRKSNFALYHLTVDDGKTIHIAWFLAAKDGEKMPAAVDVFSKELTLEQTQQLDELKAWIDANIEKAQYTDPKNKVSMKLLEVMPIQALPMTAGQVWTGGARALVTVDDMPFAFFGRAYVFSLDGCLTAGLIAGFDGERPFWDPLIQDAIGSLSANAAAK